MDEWEMIKPRTAAQGTVWRSRDGEYYKRTGDSTVHEEAEFQIFLADNGHPVPHPTVISNYGSTYYFIERSVGSASLHDEALSEAAESGRVSDQIVDRAIYISSRLMENQISLAQSSASTDIYEWFNRAGRPENVFSENPDYDTEQNRRIVTDALRRLAEVPMCHSHLDYGLPNAFPTKVIDWQHHALVCCV